MLVRWTRHLPAVLNGRTAGPEPEPIGPGAGGRISFTRPHHPSAVLGPAERRGRYSATPVIARGPPAQGLGWEWWSKIDRRGGARAAAAPATVGLGLLGLTLPSVSATAAWFGRHLVRRLGNLNRASQTAADSTLASQIGDSRRTRIGQLAPTFNHGDPPEALYEHGQGGPSAPGRRRTKSRNDARPKPELAPSRDHLQRWWPNAPGAGRHRALERQSPLPVADAGSPPGIHVIDHYGRLLEWNRAFSIIWATAPETSRLQIQQFDAQWTPRRLQQHPVTADPGQQLFQTQHRRKDSQIPHGRDPAPARLKSTASPAWHCSTRDITRRAGTDSGG